MYFSLLFLFCMGAITFFLMKSHILMVLLSLEFLALTVLMMVMNYLIVYIYDTMILVYFIIIMVCEAVMGLVLLTLMVRTHGSDYLKSSSVIKC